uniref:Uncharacterized protein n=1 Tax=Bracon brevicornis TaxID=1563983 RepID=A0A6V7KG55_9HYME
MTIETNGISRLLPIQNPSTSYDELRQSHKNQISISNCDNETSSNWKKNTCKPLRIIDKRDRNKIAAKYANTTNVKRTTGKKWWRLFKWIPMPKVLRIDITNINTGDGIADIECSREEYSMTARYIAKQNRFV